MRPSASNEDEKSVAQEIIYDNRYRDGYRKALGGIEHARGNALRHFITRVAALSNVRTALDCGCGSGMFVPLWGELFPQAKLWFCELSPVALEQLKAAFPEHADRAKLMAGEGLPFKNEMFDVVLSVEVLEHVRDIYAHLREVYRVLRPGGTFVWTTPAANAFSLEYLYAFATGQIQGTYEGFRRWRFEDPTHLRRLKTSEMAKILNNIGWTDMRFRHRSHVFSFLYERLLGGRTGRFVRPMLTLDYRLFRNLPNGASMLGAARKPEVPLSDIAPT